MLSNQEMKALMRSGDLYRDMQAGLPQERLAAKMLQHEFNHLIPDALDKKQDLIQKMFGTVGESVWIEAPIRFSYGTHIHIGDHFYANFNLTLVDDAPIYIGDHVMMAPNVTLSTAGHPENTKQRNAGYQYSKDIHIEDGVWIGAHVVVMPGVRIGKDAIIGAGSVVTKDIPAGVVAYGVPCKVIRNIDETR